MKKLFYIASSVSILLVIVGVGLLAYPKLTDWDYETFQQSLKAATEDTQATDSGLEDNAPIPDEAVGRLVIPKIDLRAYILSGTSRKVLRKGPGHYEETPLPGEGGNCAIAGHRTMYGHPFRHLDKLKVRDKIVVYTRDGKYLYRVAEKKTVKPTDLSVIDPTEEATLTLTTCHPVGSARQRLVVIAELEDG